MFTNAFLSYFNSMYTANCYDNINTAKCIASLSRDIFPIFSTLNYVTRKKRVKLYNTTSLIMVESDVSRQVPRKHLVGEFLIFLIFRIFTKFYMKCLLGTATDK